MARGKEQDTYTLYKVMEFENCTARVYKPVLTEEERNRRMKLIEKAAADLIKDAMQAEKRKVKEWGKTS